MLPLTGQPSASPPDVIRTVQPRFQPYGVPRPRLVGQVECGPLLAGAGLAKGDPQSAVRLIRSWIAQLC